MKKEEWIRLHKCCPECNSEKIIKTDNPVISSDVVGYTDDVNHATCPNCGWKGMVKKLVPDPADKTKKEQEVLSVAIRTIDRDNDTYASVEDMVASLRNFGSQLMPQLDKQTSTYTEQLLAEIIKMLISTDIQHRTGKVKKQKEIEKNNQEDINNKKDNK
jgi:DNA-directed RNA polymerase subunit RPC12/RpoP